jgi:hypothetical protein
MQKYKPETPRTVRGNTISLVEKLLDTRIDDYRKNALVDHQITKSATNRSMLARFHPARSDFTVYSTLSSFPFCVVSFFLLNVISRIPSSNYTVNLAQILLYPH